ncbi:MAG: response regulator, partial [Proteobacteria bacterium]|nr:response regulator [Pseudomonadota bacterium]
AHMPTDKTESQIGFFCSDQSTRMHRLQLGSLPEGDTVVVTVEDSGCGMNRETLFQAFDPFFSTKPDGQGTGMGLSTVLGIVLKLGGAISVDSALGSGTRVRLDLPAADRQAADAGQPEQEAVRGSGRILFVDDEATIADVASRLLQRLGYDVTTANGDREALGFLRDQPNGWDAIITDQTMPDMTGIELARIVEDIHPQIPVILTTGRRHSIDEGSLGEIGIVGIVAKPWTGSSLAQALHDALKRNDDTSKPQQAQKS